PVGWCPGAFSGLRRLWYHLPEPRWYDRLRFVGGGVGFRSRASDPTDARMEKTPMPRLLSIAAAQSGPISRQTSRSDVVGRLLDQMREARTLGCDLIVFTECALTAFFPHWWIEDEAELDAWFEREMPGPVTQALFDEAAHLGIGFS